jgi:hypothetical protein
MNGVRGGEAMASSAAPVLFYLALVMLLVFGLFMVVRLIVSDDQRCVATMMKSGCSCLCAA